MTRLRKSLLSTGLSVAFALVSNLAAAGQFTSNYIFGDSLSDQGNLAEYAGFNLPAPFFNNSFTNGPTAVSILSAGLGLSSRASLFVTGFRDTHGLGIAPGGTNYAFAGATAGNRVLPTGGIEGAARANLPQQVAAFGSTKATDAATALFTVFIGGNDVRTAAKTDDTGFVTDGVNAEIAAINALVLAGARNFLVVNVPDVGLIPEFTQESPQGQAQRATDDSILYNRLLATGLSNFNSDVNLKLFDLFAANNDFIANAASFGITNTTDPCYDVSGVFSGVKPSVTKACGATDPATGLALNINQFQYWDHIHPSAVVQAAFGARLLAAEIPEPASIALMLAGLAGVLVLQRRRPDASRAARLT
jgi:outer membrane lipase/esterase